VLFVVFLVIFDVLQFRTIASIKGSPEPKSADSGPAASTPSWDKSATFLVQIGANDEVSDNKKILSNLLGSNTMQAILVEGNPSVFILL
jgi:hypothetical protein